ncbi:MAG: CHC2 zinc finger domain-containing protein [Gallionella sp.]
MTADTLLSKLDKVKRTGQGRWLACCPSHEDRTASLSVRELDDGRVLVHCFAGCSVHEIAAAAGIELSDLFPPRENGDHFTKGERKPFPAADILRAIAFESTLVLIAGADILAGNPFNDTDRTRLALAVSRIQAALTAGGIK